MIRKASLNERGLTLIELLAVIVILGVIAMIAIIAVTNVIQTMKDRAFIGNAIAMKEAASFYIRQEVTSGNPLPEKITYKTLVEYQFIEPFKDPDTSSYLPASENTYVTVKGTNVNAVCLIADKRSLCSIDGIQKPIPFNELTTDHLTKNE
ncbi:prepilin-type N-terminal cleavage/methylation domain-containing protein [Cytobacillus eiseniae]|uniref:Prepilin-type N-terminal cleavage/methylation domain-containing protein n=1 Tax=Cytobacillus eiseniae TaxID=762947 RepID=A0ABS4RFL7_9BACI|nr:type II secretion system protein [Cytobacillus eiseniae]MBP2240587.1 prepilin-type N-terminal cleavage/methylation domain-containing protein [Cytobacillus eiseniae]